MRPFRLLLAVSVLAGTMMSAESATLWISDNAHLSAIDTASNEVRVVSAAGVVSDIAPIENAKAWVLSGKLLKKVDAYGALESVIDVGTLGARGPVRLASNPFDSTVWLASQDAIYHFSGEGALIYTISPAAPTLAIFAAPDQSVWILSPKSIAHASADGRLIDLIDLDTSPMGSPERMVVDVTKGRAWILGQNRISLIDLKARHPSVEPIHLDGSVADFTWDGRRTWAAIGKSIIELDDSGISLREVMLDAPSVSQITTLAADAENGSFWVGSPKGIIHVDATGKPLEQPIMSAAATQARMGAGVIELRLQLLKSITNSSDLIPSYVLHVDRICSGKLCPAMQAEANDLSLKVKLDSKESNGPIKFDTNNNAVFRLAGLLSVGKHHVTAIAVDQRGHTSNQVDIDFVPRLPTPQLRPIRRPSSSLVSTQSVASNNVQKAAAAGNNSAPTVSMTSPANGATFAASSNIDLSATASDSDGTIAKVEFYRGGTTLIGTDTSSPYSITWSNVAAGSYSLTAKATDNGGATKTSTALNITVTGTPPTVSITSPSNGATFSAPASISIAADAADSDGTVSKVEFFQGATLLGTDTTAPYAFSWSNVAAGTYSLTAKVTDSSGLSTVSSAVSMTVAQPNVSPLVVVTQPVACSQIEAGSPITLTADAADLDGNVTSVAFYKGTTLIGTANNAPYTVIWNTPPSGVLTLNAVVTDNRGATKSSRPISISVGPSNVSPTVTLTSPASGTSVQVGGNVSVTADASDTDGTVATVDFYAGGTLLGTSTVPPYSATWIPGGSGSSVLTARATDNAGAVTTSSPVNVTVVANALPSVSLTAPTNGASYRVGSSVALAAAASDSDGTIARVDFYANQTQIGSSTTAPYAMTWVPSQAGSYSLTAVATDNRGSSKVSDPATVSITPNSAPSVALTSPADSATFYSGNSIQFAATATDSDGNIEKVEFFSDATLIGAATVAPYGILWANAGPGNYSLTAKATDNDGDSASSSPISILVLPNIPPGVIMASPPDNSTYYAPASVSLSANALDNDGTIARVEFYQGSTLIGTATTAPYPVAWTKVPAGNYSVTAKAIDNAGATATSAPITVNVIGPTLSIATPSNNAALTGDSVIVSGSFGGPTNSGVVVNDIVAVVDGNNHFSAQVPLVSGSNTLTATVTAPDGSTSTTSVSVTSDGQATDMPLGIEVSALEGVAPFIVKFSLSNPTSGPLVVEVNGGSSTTVDAGGTGEMNFSLPSAGIYTMTLTTRDSQNTVASRIYVISVADPAQMDQLAAAVWNGMNAALIAGDKETAMKGLTDSSRAKYGPVFDVLMPTYASIAASFSPLQRGSQGSEYLEYAINRTIDGQDQIFFVYFVKGPDGVWHLDSM